MEQPKYQRVLLKLSGEALAGPAGRGIDFPFVRQVCQVVKDCADRGVQVGLVVGGGNYWRGVKDGGGQMERSRADQMGMLATVIDVYKRQAPTQSRAVYHDVYDGVTVHHLVVRVVDEVGIHPQGLDVYKRQHQL